MMGYDVSLCVAEWFSSEAKMWLCWCSVKYSATQSGCEPLHVIPNKGYDFHYKIELIVK